MTLTLGSYRGLGWYCVKTGINIYHHTLYEKHSQWFGNNVVLKVLTQNLNI